MIIAIFNLLKYEILHNDHLDEYLDVDVKKSQWFYDEVKKYSEMYTLKNKEA